MILVRDIRLPLSAGEPQAFEKALHLARIPRSKAAHLGVARLSVDARHGQPKLVYTIAVTLKDEGEESAYAGASPCVAIRGKTDLSVQNGTQRLPHRPVVCGLGPAGLFAALLLARQGYKPIVLERGPALDERVKAVEHFSATGELDPNANIQFGEGGAGTFSDGKLTTRIKDPRCRKVLEEMVAAGAPEEILYDAKPHIGTDLLRGVVKQLREKIISLGGEVRFFAKVTGFQWENDRVQAVFLQNGEKIEAEDVVLALGHSARDTFTLLYEEKFALEQKPFAMGVRIEHPQAMIDAVQYGDAAALLPAADYRLTYTTQKNRGVYTFCMCPGGYVVAAASEEGRLAVNGMSEHARDGRNANSALLVQIFPEDFGSDHPLAGMLFQRELEEKAFLAGGGSYTAPVQTVGSFLGKGKVEAAEVTATYRPAVRESSLDEIFPAFMTEALREALPAMGRKLKGFDRADAVLTAVESRSSSPIRILRDKTGMSLCKQGIYPAGEGAGYAGGIVSAAVDGIFVAEKIAEKYGWMK